VPRLANKSVPLFDEFVRTANSVLVVFTYNSVVEDVDENSVPVIDDCVSSSSRRTTSHFQRTQTVFGLSSIMGQLGG
jgi:hypothetical protein